MKKILAVNGSPRCNGNTAIVLQDALKGAASAGAETGLIQLGKLNFSGCKSCFACKRKNSTSPGKCALQDDLSPVLEELLAADALIFGTPIYFGAESGFFRNFMERLFFPLLEYRNPPSSLLVKKIPSAMICTMNVPREMMASYNYQERIETTASFARLILQQESEVLYVCDTWQFDDYSQYISEMFDVEHKAAVREKDFPHSRQQAFELGKRLAEK